MRLLAAIVNPLARALNALLDLPARIDTRFADALNPKGEE